MDRASKSKWQLRAAATIIFLLGFAAGALAFNAYRAWSRGHTEQTRRGGFDEMIEGLQLTADQKTQVHQILDQAREQLQVLKKEGEPRVNEIRQRTDERLQKVLTPDQWKQFQQQREEQRSRRGGRR
ncbi:MAG: Heavy-metal resistance [Acidobacteria bacterium]|nr:Heavy-metal resistance [Acidobacteriota bacterium]